MKTREGVQNRDSLFSQRFMWSRAHLPSLTRYVNALAAVSTDPVFNRSSVHADSKVGHQVGINGQTRNNCMWNVLGPWHGFNFWTDRKAITNCSEYCTPHSIIAKIHENPSLYLYVKLQVWSCLVRIIPAWHTPGYYTQTLACGKRISTRVGLNSVDSYVFRLYLGHLNSNRSMAQTQNQQS